MVKREIPYRQIITYIGSLYFCVWAILALMIGCNHFHVLRYESMSGKVVLCSVFLIPSFALYVFMKREHDIKTPIEFLYCVFGEKRHGKIVLVTFIFCLGQLFMFLLSGKFLGERIGGIFFILILALIFGGFQEIGFRGFLAEAFGRELSFGLSAVLTGSVWGMLYLPLFFVEGTPFGCDGFLFFLFNCVFQSIVLNALYFFTDSTAACIVFRTFWAISSVLFQGLLFSNGAYTIYSVVEMILVFGLVSYEMKKRIKHCSVKNS